MRSTNAVNDNEAGYDNDTTTTTMLRKDASTMRKTMPAQCWQRCQHNAGGNHKNKPVVPLSLLLLFVMAGKGGSNLLLDHNEHTLLHLVKHISSVWLSVGGKDVELGTRTQDQPSWASATIFTLAVQVQSSSSNVVAGGGGGWWAEMARKAASASGYAV